MHEIRIFVELGSQEWRVGFTVEILHNVLGLLGVTFRGKVIGGNLKFVKF